MGYYKVFIGCTIAGSILTPSMWLYLPVTAAEIAESALGAAEAEAEAEAEAGAAIVHLPARNPEDGRPDQTPEAFEPFLKANKQASDVVYNLTTARLCYMPVEERVRPAAVWKRDHQTQLEFDATRTRYELDCYDANHLNNLRYFYREDLVQAPLFIQISFGLLG